MMPIPIVSTENFVAVNLKLFHLLLYENNSFLKFLVYFRPSKSKSAKQIFLYANK